MVWIVCGGRLNRDSSSVCRHVSRGTVSAGVEHTRLQGAARPSSAEEKTMLDVEARRFDDAAGGECSG